MKNGQNIEFFNSFWKVQRAVEFMYTISFNIQSELKNKVLHFCIC